MAPSTAPLRNLLELLEQRRRDQGERQLYTFLDEAGEETGALTYAGLAERAQSLGGTLRGLVPEGERALLLFPPGLDFIAALFGCWYGGVLAVPAYPPASARGLPRLLAIAEDSRPALVLTTRALLARLETLAARLPALRHSRWLAIDDPSPAGGPVAGPASADAGTPAFLQYTSGSTAAPKGVVVTHGNLLHNQEMIRAAFGQSEESVVVSWLPLYHDMGLIGGVLQPLYSGGRCILFSPVAFLQRPALWLRTISRYRATTSGGPNFAYDLCARRLGEAERAGLDLSCWTTAFNGAEPVRAETLDRFAAAFAPCGFRREAFQPCYGLAEATLLVASSGPGSGPAVHAFRAEDLERGQAAETVDGRRLASCGQVWGGQRVVVCDPETGERHPDGSVGEIWVAGPSVCRGYWGRPAETAAAFGARLAGEPEAGPFLRTGDLGFFRGGELFVTGRLKDLIIIRGRNLYPQDVEITAEASHPALRPGHAAAYAVEVAGVEGLAVALELDRRATAGVEKVEEVAEAVRRAVADQHEVAVHEVVLLRYGSLPKTSSGKVQRRACREAIQRGELAVLGLSRLDGTETFSGGIPGAGETALSPAGTYLRTTAARLLNLPAGRLDPDLPLTALGLDSLSAVELKHAIESDLGTGIDLPTLLGGASVAELARRIEELPGTGGHGREPVFLPPERPAGIPLSTGQERLWFLHLADPESPAYNLASVLRLEGALHVPALWASLGEIVRRHEVLRTVYAVVGRRPVQRPLPHQPLPSALVDLSGLPPGPRAGEARRLGGAEARRAFDLTRGPVARFLLLRLDPRRHSLLATVHHVAADGWSRRILVAELGRLYEAFSAGRPSPLPELPFQYADYAVWQREWLEGREAADPHGALGGDVPPLELPADRPRSIARTARGALRSSGIDPATAALAEGLAQRSGVTLFVVLFAVFQALLARITGADRFAVGSPAANRDRRELRDLIGFFVDLLPLRADLRGNPSFSGLLERVRSSVLAAYASHGLPFKRVGEETGAVFMLQDSRGSEPRLPGLESALAEIHTGTAKFDLTLTAERGREGLEIHLEHDAGRFDGATMDRWLGHFRHLLAAVCAAPDQPLAAAPLLAEAERHQLLVESNDTRAELPGGGLVHERVAAWAAATPDALAAADGELSLTYGELDRRANQLAHRLRALGVEPEVLVGVCLERSAEQVSAQLAVFKAGGVYVPLPPDLPPARLRFLVADTGIRFLIGRSGVAPDLSPADGGTRLDLDRTGWTGAENGPESRLEPCHIAYVIYTSGSTGVPKGVAVPHAGLANLARWHQAAYGVTPADRASHLAGLGFDASVWEVWPYLAAGASLHLPPEEVRAEPRRLREWIRHSELTFVFAPTPLAEALLAGSWPSGTRVRALLTGGDRLHQPPPAGLPFALVNHYGPTESSVVATASPVPPEVPPESGGSLLPPIGRPIANTSVHVLDPSLEPVPLGVAGEVYIGGGGLARGYAGRPDLTAERFLPSPFAGEPGARLYRTGDRARVLPNGELDFLGRVDRQVKLRGHRIEPGEVEALLRRHPGVAEAVVTTSERRSGNVTLAAFLVASGETAPAADELRAALRTVLPEPMVPADFVWLDHLPLTSNGKIDHRALPALASDEGASRVAPRNAVEKVLADLWSEALGTRPVGVFDDFFALGGHSLMAAELTAAIQESFQVHLPLKDFLLAPTVAGIAEALLKQRETATDDSGIPRLRHGQPAPLSFAQQRLWFLHQVHPDLCAYNVAAAIVLEGFLDAGALDLALGDLIERHEVLRTTFPQAGGVPVQAVAPRPASPLRIVDFQGLADGEAEAWHVAREQAETPFDLAAGPLLRPVLVLAGDRSLLVLALHHIVCDGWSRGLLLGELSQLYASRAGGPPAGLRELPVQYRDFAVWQRGLPFAEQLDYWRERLGGAPTLSLPSDRPRPRVMSYRGGLVPLHLPAAEAGALRDLGRETGATAFMVLMAAFQTLLSRESGETDLVVGSPVAGRDRAETTPLIGFFVNLVGLRSDLAGDPAFPELLEQVRSRTLEAYAHQGLPFERLVEELQPERDPGRHPIFQTLLAFQAEPGPEPRLPGLRAEVRELHTRTAKYDLLLTLTGQGGALEGYLEYDAGLFDPATVARLGGHYLSLLRGVAREAGRRLSALPLLGEAERFQLLAEWNDNRPVRRLSGLCLHELFSRQAAATPEAVALVYGGQSLTYGELRHRSRSLARRLRALGVGPEVAVGVFAARTPGLVTALLAVLEAGGAYVPLEPSYPRERLAYLLAETRAAVILTQEAMVADLPPYAARLLLLDGEDGEDLPAEVPGPAATDLNLAYVIYTSGSTGRPKGVAIQHSSAVALVEWAAGFFPAEDLASVLASTSICFDMSIFELFVPLSRGGRIVLVENALACAGQDARVLNTVPSAAAELLRTGAIPPSVRTVNLGGEPLAADLVRRLYETPGVERVYNLYGPSEDTTYSTFELVPRGCERVAIGRPVAGTRAYLLDPQGNPVPLGAPGELFLAGDGLARGYINRPEATAERFVPDPFSALPGQRLYRTGDLVRWLPGGSLDFLGRLDHQVKIRGYRVEPGEIEALLAARPEVREAAVVVQEGPEGDPLLAAFVAFEDGADSGLDGLRSHLRSRLPGYMVPSRFVGIETLPLTSTGKVDRRALAALPVESLPRQGAFAAPATPVEEILAARWADLLGQERIGAGDDFFALGGHSLLATRLATRIQEDFGVELPVSAIFEQPTVRGQARQIEALRAAGEARREEPIPRAPEGPAPLSFSQERIWFLEQLEPGSAAYHLPGAVRLSGRLDAAALRGSLAEVVRRHEALRTVFSTREGRPVQTVLPQDAGGIELPLLDLSGLAGEARASALREAAAHYARRPFDLEREPGLQAGLARLGAGEHALLLNLHHIAADGWSVGILLREVAALLAAFSAGRPSPLPDLPLQYRDYAVWQRGWLRGETLAAQMAFWRGLLAPPLPVLELPADRPRAAVRGSRGADLSFRLPAALADGVARLARSAGATQFMVLLAAFQTLLHRHTGQEDLLVGTPVANRRRSEIEPLIGCFINTLVLRTGLAGDPPFSELLHRVRGAALAAYEHQNVPFERLVEELLPVRDLAHTPLFQVMFMLQNSPAPAFALPGLALEPLDLMDPGAARFELTLSLRPDGEEGLAGTLNYSADLFDRATIARLAGQLRELLESVAADPGRTLSGASLLTAAERHQLLREWNETRREAPVLPIHRQLEEQARSRPDATALLFRGDSITYRDLNRRANRLARRLRSLGAGPEVLVAIFAERSLEMVVGILGTLKAGAAYVPLDPAYPRERIVTLLDDCRPPFLLTQERLRGRLPATAARVVLLGAGEDADASEDLAGDGAAGNLAYLLYTSGSTGKPKGVLVEHRSVANFFTAMDETLAGTDPGVWLALTSISFDISVLELLWTLTRGATVVLQEEQRAGSYFAPSAVARPAEADREVELSLFYFASDEETGGDDKYRLLMEGARFADRHGFSSIWMPERHFHAFGGLYPNPSVLAAAVAAVTERVRIHAGSVVLPLHHPVRVAEEWAVVDNLSRGRAGISFASGWHADDFVFSPEAYEDRKEVMCRGVETVRRLWRGETLRLRGGLGQEVEVRLRPRPVQPELPVWITAAGSPDTFRLAGELGANLLTHLLFQDLDQVAANIALYRQAWRDRGHAGEGRVTLMLHTFIGEDLDEVRETVRGPLTRYLRTSLDLLARLAQVRGEKIDLRDLDAAEVERYLERAFDRYFERHALVGTPESCAARTDQLAAAGVDELGCLIDFGVDAGTVLASLGNLAAVRELRARRGEAEDSSVAARIARHGVTTLQCTPSLAGALAADARTLEALRSLRTLLLGGEALPAPLAERLRGELPGRIVNLYGPTETTVWSTASPVGGGPVLIGRPLANTRTYLLDRHLQPVPAGVPGELYIAGGGLARGYLGRPEVTAERFLPEPFAGIPGSRMYRTGDLARHRGDGALEYLGRNDQQVKIRGHRVELGEVEAVLARVPGVREAVVSAREVRPGDVRLTACVVPERPGSRGSLLTPRPEILAAAPEGTYFRLPNGLLMATLSPLLASLLYREVFAEDHYFRHGIALEDGACVFDVGANVGAFTLLAHQRSAGARVHSFEPIPPTFETLRSNVELYGLPVHLHPVGVAAETGTAEFTFYPQMAGLSGRYGDVEMDKELTRSIILGTRESAYPEAGGLGLSGEELDTFLDQQFESRTYTCPLRTLSDVIAEAGEERIDLLKVDVERAEVDVLRGIRDEDWPKIRQVVLEVDTLDNLREVRSLLADRGYLIEVEDLMVVAGSEGRRPVEVYMVYARREAGPATPATVTAAGLRRAAMALLPEAMVPSAFTFLDALPRTANGKIDRKALASLAAPAREPARETVPPRNEMERLVAGVWREVLQIDGPEGLGVHDNFFEAGGNSLLVTQVRARLGEALGREIPVIELFRHATVGALASYLAQGGNEAAPALEQAQARAQKLAGATQQSGAVQRQREFLLQRKRQGGRR